MSGSTSEQAGPSRVAPPPPGLARVALIGFMAAGKSTTGSALAELWRWDFLDFDREIEIRHGVSVSEFFARFGEARFREAEAELTRDVAALTGVILAPGGGWITQPGLLDLLGPETLVVWLRITPEEAVRRSRTAPQHRPLLDGPDPLAIAEQLIADREPLYRLADFAVDVDGREPSEIAAEIADRAEAD